jgi:hypothetical protein
MLPAFLISPGVLFYHYSSYRFFSISWFTRSSHHEAPRNLCNWHSNIKKIRLVWATEYLVLTDCTSLPHRVEASTCLVFARASWQWVVETGRSQSTVRGYKAQRSLQIISGIRENLQLRYVLYMNTAFPASQRQIQTFKNLCLFL